MAIFRPFRAIRPTQEHAAAVAALPYDTMSSAEARVRAAGNPHSFLHIDMAEIDLPETTDPYADIVYDTAAANLQRFITEGTFVQDDAPQYYIYRQTWRGRTQTGLVGCACIDDYQNGIIKKHELTVQAKQEDRIRHVTACNANTGPIFLAYRDEQSIAAKLDDWCSTHAADYDFMQADVRHECWAIDSPALTAQLQASFVATPALYIADGHHRSASAVHVGLARRAAAPSYTGQEEFNFFLAVCFPHEQLEILDYNRVVKDLNGHSAEDFLAKVAEKFTVEPSATQLKPAATHEFGMYLDGQWYRLQPREGTFDPQSPVGRLDVEILQRNLLEPLLNIDDPRRNKRIAFIGGIRGLGELERRCDPEAGDMRIAFAMHAPSLDDLFAIADSGNIMPPKSTWFEPKLLSGLFIHDLD
ncbi:MAG: DUF1015 family protein [Oscillospiraceae bacterium]|nr:DUF1015 family protein [Oscillospiraceae bacterium]